VCPAGKYSAAGASSCSSCPIGRFSPSAGGTSAASCSVCVPGRFAPVEGSAACADAPAGRFVSIPGTDAARSVHHALTGTLARALAMRVLFVTQRRAPPPAAHKAGTKTCSAGRSARNAPRVGTADQSRLRRHRAQTFVCQGCTQSRALLAAHSAPLDDSGPPKVRACIVDAADSSLVPCKLL
jgi:hypothetical protein